MNRIVGVRWRKADPSTYADAGQLEIRRNNYVVLEAEKGQEFCWVVGEPRSLVLCRAGAHCNHFNGLQGSSQRRSPGSGTQ